MFYIEYNLTQMFSKRTSVMEFSGSGIAPTTLFPLEWSVFLVILLTFAQISNFCIVHSGIIFLSTSLLMR